MAPHRQSTMSYPDTEDPRTNWGGKLRRPRRARGNRQHQLLRSWWWWCCCTMMMYYPTGWRSRGRATREINDGAAHQETNDDVSTSQSEKLWEKVRCMWSVDIFWYRYPAYHWFTTISIADAIGRWKAGRGGPSTLTTPAVGNANGECTKSFVQIKRNSPPQKISSCRRGWRKLAPKRFERILIQRNQYLSGNHIISTYETWITVCQTNCNVTIRQTSNIPMTLNERIYTLWSIVVLILIRNCRSKFCSQRKIFVRQRR